MPRILSRAAGTAGTDCGEAAGLADGRTSRAGNGVKYWLTNFYFFTDKLGLLGPTKWTALNLNSLIGSRWTI